MPHAELASAKDRAADSSASFEQGGALDAQGAAKRFLPFSAGKLPFLQSAAYHALLSRHLDFGLHSIY